MLKKMEELLLTLAWIRFSGGIKNISLFLLAHAWQKSCNTTLQSDPKWPCFSRVVYVLWIEMTPQRRYLACKLHTSWEIFKIAVGSPVSPKECLSPVIVNLSTALKHSLCHLKASLLTAHGSQVYRRLQPFWRAPLRTDTSSVSPLACEAESWHR